MMIQSTKAKSNDAFISSIIIENKIDIFHETWITLNVKAYCISSTRYVTLNNNHKLKSVT